MVSFLQQYAHRGQLKTLSEAMKVIEEVQPVFDERGIDVTASARDSLLSELQSEYTQLVRKHRPELDQKASGLGLAEIITFYIQVRKAKRKYKSSVRVFESESRFLREQILQDIEQKAASRLSEEVLSKLLRDEGLSIDTKQVANDINEIRKTSLETSAFGVQSHRYPSQHIAHDIQRHILSPSEINALFEQAQNEGQTTTSIDTDVVAQQDVRAASPQGLTVPPWMARTSSNQQVMQDTIALAIGTHQQAGTNQQVGDPIAQTTGKHRRTDTFGNVLPLTSATSSAISIEGSSGYDASSSRGSTHSYQSNYNEDTFAGINTQAVYNDLRRLSPEGSLESF